MIVYLVQQHQHQVEYYQYDEVLLVVVVIMKGWCRGASRKSGRDRGLLLCISLHEVSTSQDIGNALNLQVKIF